VDFPSTPVVEITGLSTADIDVTPDDERRRKSLCHPGNAGRPRSTKGSGAGRNPRLLHAMRFYSAG
jgi:hypothetical protein